MLRCRSAARPLPSQAQGILPPPGGTQLDPRSMQMPSMQRQQQQPGWFGAGAPPQQQPGGYLPPAQDAQYPWGGAPQQQELGGRWGGQQEDLGGRWAASQQQQAGPMYEGSTIRCVQASPLRIAYLAPGTKEHS